MDGRRAVDAWGQYDGEGGRFTQEDPIGIAGGLNLYGYANGDPVNFSDPFGLCCFNPVKLAVGVGNFGWGVLKIAKGSAVVAGGSATGAGSALFLPMGMWEMSGGFARVSRGLQQTHESLDDPNGPSVVNLLGLLPAGQEFDDPGEPTLLQYLGEKWSEAKSLTDDPIGTVRKWIEEYFALGRDGADEREP